MMDFDDFGGSALAEKPLSQAEKAAAVLLAMGKQVAGRLLKYFTQHELQLIIASAQSLRVIPPDELAILVAEFEDLFTEGAGLMDNAKAIEGILEEGLTPDEVDSLLGRRATFLERVYRDLPLLIQIIDRPTDRVEHRFEIVRNSFDRERLRDCLV